MILLQYALALPLEAQERYKKKLLSFSCTTDPYCDNFDFHGPLPPVKYGDIYEYLIINTDQYTKQRQNAFKSLDAYRTVCSEGWTSNISTKSWQDQGVIVLKCDIKPSQKSGMLYDTWVAIKANGHIITGHCTCMAGLSEVCNHVGAVLYKCMHEFPLTDDSDATCTSLPCKWIAPTKKVLPAKLADIDFQIPQLDKCKSLLSQPKKRKTSTKIPKGIDLVSEPSIEVQEEFFHKLSQQKHRASILSIHAKYNEPYKPLSVSKCLPATISSLYDSKRENDSLDDLVNYSRRAKEEYTVTDSEVKTLEESTRLQYKCTLWGVHRAGRVTASNFKAAVHTNPEKPSLSLVRKLCYPSVFKFKSAATIWGCEHESDAVGEFLDSIGMDHQDIKFEESGLVVNKDYPFIGATPDGIIHCSCHGTSLLEVKCPYSCRSKSIPEVADESTNFYLKPNEYNSVSLDTNHSYYYQVQCQLNVCNIDQCYFVVWAPDSVHIERIQRDSKFFSECLKSIDKLLVQANYYYRRLLVAILQSLGLLALIIQTLTMLIAIVKVLMMEAK